MSLTIIKILVIATGMLFSTANAVRRGGDGSSVGNGGGGRESLISITYPLLIDDLQRCHSLSLCQDIPRELLSCQIPPLAHLSFQNASDNPFLAAQAPYLITPELKFIVNRELLYQQNPLFFGQVEAVRYLARIFLDYCANQSFANTHQILGDLNEFYQLREESITVGIDDLDLDKEDLIFVRSYHQYLILESRQETIVLTCSMLVDLNCQRFDASKQQDESHELFKYLSLTSEEIKKSVLTFHLQGHYGPSLFSLRVNVDKGLFREITINGQQL